MPETADLEGEVRRLAGEALAARTILAHVLARLSASAAPEIAAAVRRGLDEAERALRAGGGGAALAIVEEVKGEALRAQPSGGFKEAPGAFHAESNDQWPEDDY